MVQNESILAGAWWFALVLALVALVSLTPQEAALAAAAGATDRDFRVTDSYGDGTPDFLRLTDPGDPKAFREAFTTIVEYQSLIPTKELPHEITDCAALLRYGYREALRKHDGRWIHDNHLEGLPPLPSITGYHFPATPLRASLFRVHPGAFRPSDLENGSFAEFADAHTLLELNTFFISRDLRDAQPGDLLFYRQLEQNSPFHSMVFIGRSHFASDGAPSALGYVVYHTGPIGGAPGEMRRVQVSELLRHPSPRWRPVAGNSNFLGVYRWNILKGGN